MSQNNKVLLGLSGGADSEYSAKLLLDEGYEVCGMYINMLKSDTSKVETVSSKLGIPLNICEMHEVFQEKVISNFIESYKYGKTPNPCVECNRYVKIQTLIEESEKMDIPFIATGHYANVTVKNGRYAISKGKDLKKDQSYFLWKLTQNQIKRLIFPLGNVIKETVLSYEGEGYKESQDICFIESDYREYLSSLGVSTPKGKFLDISGKIVGIHNGIHNYTRGQRKGLGIALGYPAFVTKIDPCENTVTLGSRDALKVHTFKIENLNFQLTDMFSDERVFDVKTRYRAVTQKASVKMIDSCAVVTLFEGDDLVTPGQSAVFYEGDSIAFGGEISEEGMK